MQAPKPDIICAAGHCDASDHIFTWPKAQTDEERRVDKVCPLQAQIFNWRNMES